MPAEAGERFLEQHHLLRVADGRITIPGEAEASPRRRGQPETPVPTGQATPVPPMPQ